MKLAQCGGRCLALLIVLSFLFACAPAAHGKFKYKRLGNAADAHTTPQPGFALMGGGPKLDEAFRFLCLRAAGGDFLVLSAHDEDAYLDKENSFIKALCRSTPRRRFPFSAARMLPTRKCRS